MGLTAYSRKEAEARAHEWRRKIETDERRRIARLLSDTRRDHFSDDNELAHQLGRMLSTLDGWLLGGAEGDPFER